MVSKTRGPSSGQKNYKIMSYRKINFANNEIYHVVLKAMDGTLLFKNNNDYYRGIFSIYEFNNSLPVSIKDRRIVINRFKNKIFRGPSSGRLVLEDNRDKLVEVWAFSLMPDHIHLLLKQIQDHGITRYASKTGTGFAGYYNRKYKRRGHLFQNRFYSVHVNNDDQLRNAFTYIHTNPLSIFSPNWKDIRMKNPEECLDFLSNYKWSSYQDYIGIKNFPSITDRNFILELMNSKDGVKGFTRYWIEYKGRDEIEKYKGVFLED
jgi:REP-associated tyrosine transposase